MVLLTDDDRPATLWQLRGLSANVVRFSRRGGDDLEGFHNYYEATSGLGSITMDGLLAARKPATRAPTALPASFGEAPSAIVDSTPARPRRDSESR